MVLYERQLILTAFQVRVLVEQHKVRKTIADRELACMWCAKTGSDPVTRINAHRLDRHFALDYPKEVKLRAWDLANQFIHHYEMYAASEGPRFSMVVIFSDRMKNKGVYLISIPELLDFFDAFAGDESAVSERKMTWNPKKEDFDVVVD